MIGKINIDKLQPIHFQRIGVLVDALRSGEYVKGRKTMRSRRVYDCFYCPLGVACEISKLGRWNTYNDIDYSYECESEKFGRELFSYAMPNAVSDYYGFNIVCSDPVINEDNIMVYADPDILQSEHFHSDDIFNVSCLNDTPQTEVSLVQMADLIEKTYLAQYES